MLSAIKQALEKQFDIVKTMPTAIYAQALKLQDKPTPPEGYHTTFVVGLAYPKRIVKASDDTFVPSFYCFGKDYHTVLKTRLADVLNGFSIRYETGVDNHPWDERLAAVLSGVGFFGKNQLIIHESLGSYFFLGLAFVDLPYEGNLPVALPDGCGDCRKCLDACPTQAISGSGYRMNRCLSFVNQSKQPLSKADAMANYCLFGCDLCQLACPKNQGKGTLVHPEFAPDDADTVRADDLFTMTERVFGAKHPGKAYLWKGKTVLMRNGVLLLWRKQNHAWDDALRMTLPDKPDWYRQTVEAFLADAPAPEVEQDILKNHS
jgi:epoxyqueuosine reductase